MRLALAQINSVVGDIDGNAASVVDWLGRAREANADLVLFPELVVTGYPPEDLLLRPGFVRAARRAVDQIAKATHGITVLVGAPHLDTDLYNACFVLAHGEVRAIYKKRYLPNYGVFDEDRYFAAGRDLFLLRLGPMSIVGSSPEVLVRVEGDRVDLRPIAGTHPRGATETEDREIEERLKNDPKERAEHVMLVDLGRNDVGRVSELGSVKVTEFMEIERYSHVMHLVSHVTGKLKSGSDALDVLQASFPAGTLSGAPKIRAMEIIDHLEPTQRGPYGGAVGYVSYSGNLDSCITIRTIVCHGRRASVQVGAGIVADSDPKTEWLETCSKARGMILALRLAAGTER